MSGTAGVDARCRLRVALDPPGTGPSRMVVTAGDHRVTLEVRHDPDGDVLRVVVDIPSSRVEVSSQSYAVDPAPGGAL